MFVLSRLTNTDFKFKNENRIGNIQSVVLNKYIIFIEMYGF